MVEEVNEMTQINEFICNKRNFLLSGGAGSGKTYSLVEVVHKIYEFDPLAEVACITYTNVAANEIRERAPYEKLRVSTIHDFLWEVISGFQVDIKKAIIQLIAENKISYSNDNKLDVEVLRGVKIEYKEWKKVEYGIISHDEVICIAEYLFANNKLLCDIVKDRYNYILVDEYQDTFKSVIKILLDHLSTSKRTNVIGFFGDAMQSIFPNGVGSIKEYVERDYVKEVVKIDNRRNPKSVISLINNLRSDGLLQKPANDSSATNFGVEGSIKFIYSLSDTYNIGEIKKLAFFDEFDFNNNRETKELYLIHNLIADKAGFPSLIEIYDKDGILSFKEKLRKYIKDNLIEIDISKSFGEAIDEVDCAPTANMRGFIERNQELYEEARGYRYSQFKNIFLNKDQLIGDKKSSSDHKLRKGEKRDALIKHLFHIQECVFLYSNKKYNDFIRKTNYPITSIKSKKQLESSINQLTDMSDEIIEDVIEYAHESGIWRRDDKLDEFIEKYQYVYNRVKQVKFNEVVALYNYVEDYTPYSTQHNIKGAEFDNVFVVLDNGGWNNYNFEYLFTSRSDKASVVDKTQKIFYVCCSRAKKNLVVFFHNPSDSAVLKAKEWFGVENVHSL